MTLLAQTRCRQGFAVMASIALCLLVGGVGLCQDADKPAGDVEIAVSEGDVWRIYDAEMNEVSRLTVTGADPAGQVEYELAAPPDAEPKSKKGSAEEVADAVKREIKKGDRATRGYFMDPYGGQFAAIQSVLAADVKAPPGGEGDEAEGAEGAGGPGGGPGGPGGGPGGPGGGPGGPGAGPGGPGGPGGGPGGAGAAPGEGAPGEAPGGEAAPEGEAKAGLPIIPIAGGAVVVLVIAVVLVLMLKKKKAKAPVSSGPVDPSAFRSATTPKPEEEPADADGPAEIPDYSGDESDDEK